MPQAVFTSTPPEGEEDGLEEGDVSTSAEMAPPFGCSLQWFLVSVLVVALEEEGQENFQIGAEGMWHGIDCPAWRSKSDSVVSAEPVVGCLRPNPAGLLMEQFLLHFCIHAVTVYSSRWPCVLHC